MTEKEKIYNEEIAPLILKIFDICKDNDIQMISSFCVKSDEDSEKNMDTYVDSEERSKRILNTYKVLRFNYKAVEPDFEKMSNSIFDYEDEE